MNGNTDKKSSVGWFSSGIEFGITDKGILYMNKQNIDVLPDSYEEVEGWKILPRIENVRTKKLPSYLAD